MDVSAWHMRTSMPTPETCRGNVPAPSQPQSASTHTMSQRALALPLRTRILRPQWVCRRCLTTEVEPASPFDPPPPAPASTPDKISERASATTTPPTRTPKDRILSRALPHRIPDQYLQHSTSDDLPEEEQKARAQTTKHQDIRGVVVSTGLMDKTVRVRVPGRRWNGKVGKVCCINSYKGHTCSQ